MNTPSPLPGFRTYYTAIFESIVLYAIGALHQNLSYSHITRSLAVAQRKALLRALRAYNTTSLGPLQILSIIPPIGPDSQSQGSCVLAEER